MKALIVYLSTASLLVQMRNELKSAYDWLNRLHAAGFGPDPVSAAANAAARPTYLEPFLVEVLVYLPLTNLLIFYLTYR
jgi:hypothetical protein